MLEMIALVIAIFFEPCLLPRTNFGIMFIVGIKLNKSTNLPPEYISSTGLDTLRKTLSSDGKFF